MNNASTCDAPYVSVTAERGQPRKYADKAEARVCVRRVFLECTQEKNISVPFFSARPNHAVSSVHKESDVTFCVRKR